jgi:hypothetical protein
LDRNAGELYVRRCLTGHPDPATLTEMEQPLRRLQRKMRLMGLACPFDGGSPAQRQAASRCAWVGFSGSMCPTLSAARISWFVSPSSEPHYQKYSTLLRFVAVARPQLFNQSITLVNFAFCFLYFPPLLEMRHVSLFHKRFVFASRIYSSTSAGALGGYS